MENFLSDCRYRKITLFISSSSEVLDLGCGYNGRLLQKIESKISRGVGLDISVSKDTGSEKIKLIKHDLNQPLPFSEDEFDTVTSLAVLEHLDEPQKSLQEIRRVLKPGGKLLLTTPSTYGKPVLDFLAFLHLVSLREIEDHKSYFNKKLDRFVPNIRI